MNASGRPPKATTAVNCQADSFSVGTPADIVASLLSPDELDAALAVARGLIEAGVPVFVAQPAVDAQGAWQPSGGTGGCGYHLPRGWQNSLPDSSVLDTWRPGAALGAVMGHRFDLLDVDPRNGGNSSSQELRGNGEWPRSLGLAATPSGGTHELVAALGVGSRDGVVTGIDLKGGRDDGSSRGFGFISPTVKLSKTTGVLQPYRWLKSPDLTTDLRDDKSGETLAARVQTSRTHAHGGRGRPGSAVIFAVSGGPITVGRRRQELLSEVGRLRFRDVPMAQAEVQLRKVWAHCEQPTKDPFPWEDAQALLCDGYARWPAGLSTSSTAAVHGKAAPGSPGRFFTREGGLRAKTLARAVVDRIGHLALSPDDRLWIYKDGVYIDDGGDAVREAVVTLLGERHRASHLTNVLQVLKARHVTARLPGRFVDPDGTFLNLPNGLLDWKQQVLLPHNPLVPSVHRIPVPWDTDASCPATLRFLEQLFGEDPAMIEFVEEIAGAVLYGGAPFHQRAIMLLGGGKNGKGSYLKWLQGLVGARNVTHVKPQALDNERFATAELYGKLANLAGDVAPTAFKQAERFKEVTAGDTINAEHKYGQPFSFIPVSTVIASFNEMPATADRSDGFFRRWLVLPFPHRFVDAAEATGAMEERLRDKHAAEAVLTHEELLGFLVRAVRGLQRLEARGDFNPPATVKKATDQFREHGDPMVDFLREHYVASPDAFLPRAFIKTAYDVHCDTSGTKPLGPARFYEHLPSAGKAALGCHLRESKRNGTRGYVGMAAK